MVHSCMHSRIRAFVSFRFVDTLRHASSTHTHDMSDERTYIMIKYVSDDDECYDDDDEDDVFTRLSLSLSLNTSRRRTTDENSPTI